MKKEMVLEEIDRRIKRLLAEIEIIEDALGREERKKPEVRDYSTYYLVGMLLWFAIGLVLLLAISKRAPSGVKIPTGLYALIVIAFSVPLAYHLLTRERKEEPGKDLLERERMARLVLKAFYEPLRKAVEENDTRAIEFLAEELLRNPDLAGAMERLGEGNPKLIAYALLLYSNFGDGLEEEIEETVQRLHNRAVKALLLSRLGKGYNGEERSIDGEHHEV